MEDILSAGLSKALGQEVVIGNKHSMPYNEEISFTECHNFTLTWKNATYTVDPCNTEGELQIFIKTLDGNTLTYIVKPTYTIGHLKFMIQCQDNIPTDIIRLGFAGKTLEDMRTLQDYGVGKESTLYLNYSRKGGGPSPILLIDSACFDPQFDYTYASAAAEGENFCRGGRKFERPYGWEKSALKVLGKFENDDWLGVKGCVMREEEVSGEWPVSYHGTQQMFAESIAKNGYELRRGKRFKFGRGIYSTPSTQVAEQYATEFDSGGLKYKLIFMNRVNPDYIREVNEPGIGDYFITSDETQIRPYAILLKKLEDEIGKCNVM